MEMEGSGSFPLQAGKLVHCGKATCVHGEMWNTSSFKNMPGGQDSCILPTEGRQAMLTASSSSF